jgi:hypothetical protein
MSVRLVLNGITADLAAMPLPRLQSEWRRVHKAAPPASYTADLPIRGIAHRLQEQAMGGLSLAARRELERRAGGNGDNGRKGGRALAATYGFRRRALRKSAVEHCGVRRHRFDRFPYREPKIESVVQPASANWDEQLLADELFGFTRQSLGSVKTPAHIAARTYRQALEADPFPTRAPRGSDCRPF